MTAHDLLATLHGRGVVVTLDGDSLELDAPKGSLSDLLPDVQRFKPALLELLAPEAPATEPAAPSPFRRVNEFVLVPANPKPDVELQRVFEIALAREILDAAYLDQGIGAWKICWAKGRHAWQRLCLDMGGELEESGLPSMSAAAAIEWAKSRFEAQNSALKSEEKTR